MKENLTPIQSVLTPRADFNYSINRMAEIHDAPKGGSAPTGDLGRETQGARIPPTPERIEAARRAWGSLMERVADPGERETMRVLAEMGKPPIGGGAEVIDPTDYPDPALVPFVENLNNELTALIDRGEPPILDLDYVNRQLVRLERLIDEERIADRGQATRLQQTLNAWGRESFEAARNAARAERGGRREPTYFIIQREDMDELDASPMGWLDNQFDTLYKIAAQGQELSSPIVQQIERAFEEASRYVRRQQPDASEEFNTSFTIRFNLLSMRTTIGYRSIENIQRAATTLRLHGLMNGISMEEGRVGSMFNRLHELLEDERLKNPDHHATPEVVSQLQDNVIKEQLAMAERGVGQFTYENDPEFANLTPEKQQDRRVRDITRAVRIAYDVFVSSQRQAVIVARGRHLTGDEAYFSDTAGPLNVYNLEDLLIKKFGIYNAHDQEFVRRIKLDMAESSVEGIKKEIKKIRKKAKVENRALTADEQERVGSLSEELPKRENLTESEKEDLGTRLFRDLFAVADFFSSGWRIKGILDSIDERFIARFEKKEGSEVALERARDFALFMRLNKAPKVREKGVEGELKEQVWGRIAEIRPEEVVRLFTERDVNNPSLRALFGNGVFTRNSVHSYGEFKDKYGSILRSLRENGYKQMRQIRIGEDSEEKGLTPEDKLQISQFFGEDKADDIREMFRLMTDFSKNSITDLLNNNKFEDIYTRTLLIDDALLGQLEDPHLRKEDGEIIKEKRFVPLSDKYAADQGGDALVRTWTDTANAMQAGQSLIKFIQSQDGASKIKAAEEFGEFTSLYNGQAARAKCIRYTIGTFLSLSKSDFIWDALGVGKLPFRKAISEIERIYGPQAMPMSRDQLRGQLDNMHHLLVSALEKNFSTMPPEKQKEELEKAEAFYHDLEKVLEVTTNDMVKRRFFSFLIFLILAGIIEAYKVGEETVKTK